MGEWESEEGTVQRAQESLPWGSWLGWGSSVGSCMLSEAVWKMWNVQMTTLGPEAVYYNRMSHHTEVRQEKLLDTRLPLPGLCEVSEM